MSPLLVTTLLDAALCLALATSALVVLDVIVHDVRMGRAMAQAERAYQCRCDTGNQARRASVTRPESPETR